MSKISVSASHTLTQIFLKRIAFTCAVILLFSALLFTSEKPVQSLWQADDIQQQSAIDSSFSSVRVIAVGDIMLGSNYPSSKYLAPNDGNDILLEVEAFLTPADIVFGNLEGVLLTANGIPKGGSNSPNMFAFKSPDHYVNHLKKAGFNLLNLANNHSNDFGLKGRQNTMRLLDEAGIHYAGLWQCPSKLFVVNGLTIGFCGFAPNLATLQLNDYALVTKTIQELKKDADIVIVSFHCGAEGTSHQHITQNNEYYLGENRGNPHRFARIAIDAGADLLLGHGPHVPRAVDLYKDRFIVYSMGNFATYKMFSLKASLALAPVFSINLAADGTFMNAQIFSMIQKGEGGPIPDENNAALKKIKELTKIDFPNSPLKIDDDGKIWKEY